MAWCGGASDGAELDRGMEARELSPLAELGGMRPHPSLDPHGLEIEAAVHFEEGSAEFFPHGVELAFLVLPKRFAFAAHVDDVFQDGLELFRAQTKTYASTAGEQIDVAQKYVVERVQERPMTATVAALGAGVLIGLLLAGGRDR